MFRDLNACLGGKCQREDLARRDIARIVRLGELRDGEPGIRQADGGLGARTTER